MAISIGSALYGRPLRKINCAYQLGCGTLATGHAPDKVSGKPVPACDTHRTSGV